MTAQAFNPSDYRTWKDWKAAGFGQYDRYESVAFHRELELSGVPRRNVLSLLEIGFGNGELSSWAKAQGWSVVGTELDPELVARANAMGIEAHSVDRQIDEIAGERRFDVIVAFDVFEHLTVEELLALLAAARRCLKPDGRVIARFPSGDSPFAGSAQHSDLTHKLTIGRGIVQQLAQRTGFSVLQVREPVLPIRGVGISRGLRRMGVLALRRPLSALINLAFHDGQPLVLTRNMVAVLSPT